MQKIGSLLLAMASLAGALSSFAQIAEQTFTENFEQAPGTNRWVRFGEAGLFQWQGGQLQVTWDSSRSNSYFLLPLGTILTRQDDFSVALDLRLRDIAAGVVSNKPGTLQLAFGFQNRADAEQPGFARGTGENTPNLVEFNYFPDTGFGATVWPAALSTNSAMNYNGAADFAIFELPLEVTLRVSLRYSAASETISLALTDNGALAAPVNAVRLATNATSFTLPFTQFRVDAFAITSYSDAGQNSPFAGSLLAHGSVDNIVIKVPPPPVQDLRGEFVEARWRARFQSRARWAYRLEASADLREWQPVGGFTEGTGSVLSLGDEAGAGAQRFYRIFARRND